MADPDVAVTELLLGPVLRHVGENDATVWVETSGPCVVEILGHRERTWQASGHHYALVLVEGLKSGSTTPYEVRLDDELVWPLHDSPCPPVIRTLRTDGTLTVVFGSCRFTTSRAMAENKTFDADALDAYSRRMMAQPPERWPDALLLLGDQVYADELSPEMTKRISAIHDVNEPPGMQVRNFEEYTWLYAESWSDPEVRWLLSTLPSSMIFDDHDVRDDWNTSQAWREDAEATSWWEERIVGALSSYWVYQHLGNLSPIALADNDLYQQVRTYGDDVEPLLREFASAADEEADGAKGTRWSYRRDLGPARLLMIDTRCGRVLADGHRSMVSEPEFGWIEDQTEGVYDHLLVGSSLPWLLPRALHDLESWNEALASGAKGPRLARWSEKLRRVADLEHWAAFRESFERLGRLFVRVGSGEYSDPSGRPPATVCVLSGDVHHAYAAEADFDSRVRSRVYQLTCSPLHNHIPMTMRLTFRLAWRRGAQRSVRFLLNRVFRVPTVQFGWSRLSGPFFGDQVATLHLNGPWARVEFEQASTDGDGIPRLTKVADLLLADDDQNR